MRSHRDIQLIAVSRGITMAGAEAGYIALLALAWHLTGDATSASLVLLASVLARTAFAPVAGWIGDHLDRRSVVVWSELVVAGAFGSLFLAHSMLHLLVAMVVGTSAAMTGGAALDASIPNLVGPDGDLAKANSTMGIGRTAGHMVGPAAGGALIALFGAHAAFLLDGATSVLAAVLFLLVRGEVGGGASADAEHERSRDRSMLAGLRFVGANPVLQRYFVATMAFCVCFAYVTAAELPLAVQHGVDEAGLGMIISSWCAGSLVGSWMARRLRDGAGAATVLARVSLVSGVVFALTGLTPWFSTVLALMAVGGLVMAFADVAGTGIMQSNTADDVRARVLAALQGLSSASFGCNLALAGLLVHSTSAGAVYVFASAWCVVAALGYVSVGRVQRARQLDDQLRIAVPRHALETDLAESA